MKPILIIIACTVFSYTAFSQDWHEIKANDSVVISVKEIHYQDLTNDIDHQRLVFKYENTTSSPIEIHFNRELIYNEKKYPQEEDFSIQIPANGTRQYDDSKNHDKTYYVFQKDNQGWVKGKLDNFNIIHLKIKQL